MDAERYRSHYNNMVEAGANPSTLQVTEEPDFVRMLWYKLLDAYIAPNGPREVNLPASVRDRLMSLPGTSTPPDPSELDVATKIIYELMDESVLVPFLNSVALTRAPESLNLWGSEEHMTDVRVHREDSPPSANDTLSPSARGLSPRLSHQSHLGRPGPTRLSTILSSTSATSSAEAIDSMTDDSTDSPSPSGSALEPMTPPNTPPTSHVSFKAPSPGSGRTVRSEESGWKKMGAKLGWKRSRSGPNTSGPTYPSSGKGESDDSKGSGF